MNFEEVVEEARKSIGRFCIEECKAYCCRKGFLDLDDVSVELVCAHDKQLLMKKGHLKKDGGDYSLDMAKTPCPALREDLRCDIYSHPDRPSTCHKFPLFIDGDKIIVSTRCLAVNSGILYPFFAQLRRMGYRFPEGEPALRM